MFLLFLHIYVAAAVSPAAVGVEDCASLFVSTRERMERVLDRAFARGARTRADAILMGLDRDIVDWAEARLNSFTPEKRDAVFRILESHVFGYPLRRVGRVHLKGCAGWVDWKSGVPQIVTNGFERSTEAGREVFVHELEHVFRDTVGGDLELSAARMERSHRRDFEVYRDEIYAWRESYRHYRRNYSYTDLPRLEEFSARFMDLRTDAIRARLIAESGKTRSILVEKRPTTVAEWRQLLRLSEALALAKLHDEVEMALGLSEFDYVKSSVSGYAADQRRAHLERRWLGRIWFDLVDTTEELGDRLIHRWLARRGENTRRLRAARNRPSGP